MKKFFKEIWMRIVIDWQEWRNYKRSVWNVKRDKKQINRAIHRATSMNSMNGRTYYILRSNDGNINEISAYQLLKLKKAKQAYFPKYRNIEHIYSESFAIITSREVIRNNYLEVMNTQNNNEVSQLSNELRK